MHDAVSTGSITIAHGLQDNQRTNAAALYYSAFRQKLHPVFGFAAATTMQREV